MKPPINDQPLVVSWGLGQDSTGMIIGLLTLGIVPDVIAFADVGSEKPESYRFKEKFDAWLERQGVARSITVQYAPKEYKHWPPYYTLLENCLTNVTLPSLAYGYHTCSIKWKLVPINQYLATLAWVQAFWKFKGNKILKAIGFDSSPHERMRASRGCRNFSTKSEDPNKFEVWYPLQDWGWQREDCVQAIRYAGLTVPPKSSCFFCPAMKPHEVDTLSGKELAIIVVIEARTRDRHLAKAKSRGWPRGEGIPLIEGLWRRAVKGFRGATPRPGSMTEYIRQKGLLPSHHINRIIDRTPTTTLSQSEFERLGFRDWKHWLEWATAE